MAIIFSLFATSGNASDVNIVNSQELLILISQNEDPLMTSNDLAFFLVIHSFDATPRDGYVEIKLNNAV